MERNYPFGTRGAILIVDHETGNGRLVSGSTMVELGDVLNYGLLPQTPWGEKNPPVTPVGYVHVDPAQGTDWTGEVTLTPYQANPERFTPEGIDRQFRAPHDFVPDREAWKRDAQTSWVGIPNEILAGRYQRHFETYIRGCNDFNIEPTYEGFRQWMIDLRDMDGDDSL